MNLYLCGFQGVGKTYFGKRIAAHLKCAFFDVDDEALVGTLFTSAREQYLSLGEQEFRKREERVVQELTKKEKSVIALGGGSLMSALNQEAIKQSGGVLIYLYRPLQELQDKVKANPPPFLQGSIGEMFLARHHVFSSLAHTIIPVHVLSEEMILKQMTLLF